MNKKITDIKNHVFSFNSMEVEALKKMGHFRSDFKVKANYSDKNMVIGRGNDYFNRSFGIHYMGVAGEYAVASAVNGFFDPMPKKYGDKNAPDVLVGINKEIKIAVKTTKYNPPIFKMYNLELVENCTHMALCCYKEPKLEIAWIKERNEFMEEIYERDFGYGNHFCVD